MYFADGFQFLSVRSLQIQLGSVPNISDETIKSDSFTNCICWHEKYKRHVVGSPYKVNWFDNSYYKEYQIDFDDSLWLMAKKPQSNYCAFSRFIIQDTKQ